MAQAPAHLADMLEREQNGHVETTRTGGRLTSFQIIKTGHIGAVRCRVITVRQWLIEAGRTQLANTEDKLYCRQTNGVWLETRA